MTFCRYKMHPFGQNAIEKRCNLTKMHSNKNAFGQNAFGQNAFRQNAFEQRQRPIKIPIETKICT
jgi:hypothetical protein